MQRAMEKHVQTLRKDIACDTSEVSGVRSENHVECVCFEPHSISHLCLSYSCSSVCTFADVVDPVNRLQWRRGTRKLTVLLPWTSREIFGRGIGVCFLARQICGAGTRFGNISAHSAPCLSIFRRTSLISRQRAFGQFCWWRGHRQEEKNGFLARLIRGHLSHMLARTT